MNSKVQYALYLPKKLKEELTKEAKSRGLTLNAYIIVILGRRSKNE